MKVQCRKCRHKFFITKEEPTETSAKTIECPRCKIPQEGINECQYCGLVFKDSKKQQIASVHPQENLEGESKKAIGLIAALSWIFGFLFAFAGLGSFLGQKFIQGFLYLVVAAFLIPIIVKRLPFRLPTGAKVAIIIACLLGSAMVPELLYHEKQPTPTKSTVKQNYKQSKSRPTKIAIKKLSPEMKSNIDKYINDWIRTKRFIISGFWDGASSP